MLVITNRNIQKQHFEGLVGNDRAFGEQVNTKGPGEVRLAWASKNNDQWQVELVPEPKRLTVNNLPSKSVFCQLRNRLQAQCKNCLFFIHGYNQDFKKSLEKAQQIEQRYGVEVVLFSWPSNTGGFAVYEYRQAKRVAQASVAALDASLMKLGGYLCGDFDRQAQQGCRVKFSLMAYSLGCFLFKNYVQDAVFERESNVFENIILCQADVDNKGHADWIDDVHIGKRNYITINENDWVLKWSDANFQRSRLGRTAQNLNAQNAIYLDVTDAPGVERKHGLFYAETNATIKSFFDVAINGGRAEEVSGLEHHTQRNAYVVI